MEPLTTNTRTTASTNALEKLSQRLTNLGGGVLRYGLVGIGSCGVRITSVEKKQGTFGCELSQTHWGKGYAREASRAVINFGFTELDLHRIYAETNSENLAAIALAKKLGNAG